MASDDAVDIRSYSLVSGTVNTVPKSFAIKKTYVIFSFPGSYFLESTLFLFFMVFIATLYGF